MANEINIAEARARIKARAWRNLAQSELDVKGFDQNTLDDVISLVSDAALLELDEGIAGTMEENAPAKDFAGSDEKVLWEGRPFLSLNTTYIITTERVRVVEGILGKDRQDVELVRVQDIDQTQSVSERLLNIGDLHVQSHDRTHPLITLRNVKDPLEVHEILRRAVLDARKRHKLVYREEM